MYARQVTLAIAAVFIGCMTNAAASTIFVANLTENQEVPPTGSTGTGFETAVLNDTETELTVNLTFTSLASATTMAHIHCCAGIGTSAGVALPFVGFPTGVTSGTYNHTFTLATDLVGSITAPAFVSALFAGNTYSNVHTSQFPGGEIRGQLLSLPEPGAASLLLAGLGTLGFLALRRKRS